MDSSLGSGTSTGFLPESASSSLILSTVRYNCFTNLLFLAPFALTLLVIGKNKFHCFTQSQTRDPSCKAPPN